MRSKEIAREYNIEQRDFEYFLLDNKETIKYKYNPIKGFIIEDEVEEVIKKYNDYLKEKENEIEKERIKQEEKRIKQEVEEEKKLDAMSKMLVTSGFSFDGYKIIKYSGYISGDDAIQISRGKDSLFDEVTDVSEGLMKALKEIRRNALNELKEAAYYLGCNAVIGVDFDYITLDPETANSSGGTTYLPYVFGVTANGNAVIIEKK